MNTLRVKIALLMVVAIVTVVGLLTVVLFYLLGPPQRLHSLSPVMHNTAFQAAGIDAVYVPLTVHDFGDFLAFAEGMGIEGASVTIPFKLDALAAAQSSDQRMSEST